MNKLWIIPLIVTSLKYVRCETRCNLKDNCICLPESSDKIEWQCPRTFPDVGRGFVIHLEKQDLLIDCISLEKSDNLNLALLPNITLENLDRLQLRTCPLPRHNLREVLDRLSTKYLKDLHIGPSSLVNVTLTKEFFQGLDDLEFLEVSENDLIIFEEDVFSELPNLSSLSLRNNQIQLKQEFFVNNALLTFLDISENGLRSLPRGLFTALKKLKILHLWSNNLAKIDAFDLEGLTNVSSLELRDNSIEIISDDAFYKLENLTQINLSQNYLTNVSSLLFSRNKKLKTVKWCYNYKNLTLPDYLLSNLPLLENVYLCKNTLETLPPHLFENSSNILQIHMYGTGISELPLTLFNGLTNLEKLNLSGNNITSLPNVFTSLKKLKHLELQNNFISEIDAVVFSQLVSLNELDLSSNRIVKISSDAFDNTNLIKIDLSHNLISTSFGGILATPILNNVLHLQEVDLSNNLITEVVDVIWVQNKVYLTKLDLSNNRISKLNVIDFQPVGNRKLTVNLDYNNISTVDFAKANLVSKPTESFDARSINSLRQAVIYMSNNQLNCDCHNYDFWRYLRGEIEPEIKVLFDIQGDNLVCQNPPLQQLTLHALPSSLLLCSVDELLNTSSECPEGCSCHWRPSDNSIIFHCSDQNRTNYPEIYPLLEEIRGLNSTSVAQWKLRKFNQTELNLVGNSLTSGPDRKFSCYDNVTKLFLARNMIEKVRWLPPKLEQLTLDNNRIETLNYEVLNTLNNTDLTHLTLFNNPWSCDCQTVNFTTFLREQSRRVNTSYVFCANSTTRLIDLNGKNLCREWHMAYTFLLVMAVVLLMTSALALYFRYQQELKVWLYAKNLCLWWVTEEELDKDKTYDAFLSYCHKDEEFVVQNLLPVLQNGPQPYKLCVHFRDWVPGEFITKQITRSVMESRRTLVVLSPNFLESVWGIMEFRTAHTQAMIDGRARVIVVLLGDIKIDSLDSELKSYLNTNTYVKWGDPYFWNKLKYALPHSKRNMAGLNQRHANVMSVIDDKFSLVTPVTTTPGSTPPVLSLDAALLKKHPLQFVGGTERDTPPAEAGTLLTT